MSTKRSVDEQLGAATSNPSTSKRVKTEEETSEMSFKLIDKEDQVEQAIAKLASKKLLAVDCEGVDLGRDGSLTVLQISSRDSPCYIFDIQKLGKRPFDLGLKRLLEDKTITKLMFDCKEDSDALAHLFNVYIDGVYDIQLYEMMYRDVALPEEKKQEPVLRRGWIPKRAGMIKCIKKYVKEERFESIKERGRSLLSNDNNIWEKRPIANDLLEYAAVKTPVMFLLFDHFTKRMPLSNHVDRERLEISSDRFVKYFREMPSRSCDKYERNGFLPLNIIPKVVCGKVDTAVPDRNTKCIGCKKVFSSCEFSSYELSDGTQKCTVCKKVDSSRPYRSFGCEAKKKHDSKDSIEDW